VAEQPTYLDRILDAHRSQARRDGREIAALVDQCATLKPARGFRSRLVEDALTGLAVISAIKRRSPSQGELAPGLDPAVLARAYEDGGASCLSVLTDHDFFGGSLEDLQAARQATSLPVLRKDFTVSAHDVCDARLMGADCVLLIAAALSDAELQSFFELAGQIGLDVLVEIHDEGELDRALAVGADLIGVNQRDLVTFAVDHDRAIRMGGLIPADVVRVAESGVRGVEDAHSLWAAGYHAVLVGESLVTASDPVQAVRQLRSA
jgi:indole-3-glycerol phosphate synthase